VHDGKLENTLIEECDSAETAREPMTKRGWRDIGPIVEITEADAKAAHDAFVREDDTQFRRRPARYGGTQIGMSCRMKSPRSTRSTASPDG
jgi:hypothetical protein